MKRALSVLLLLALPALAEENAKPAHEAKTVRLPPLPLERTLEEATKLSRELPLTERVAVKAKGTMKLAILLVELADSPRPSWGKEAWQSMLFSKGQYTHDPDGQPAFGSVHDYYSEQSAGKLDLEGKVFDWIQIPARRATLEERPTVSLSAHRELMGAAIDRLLAREGAHALDDFQALGFIVSGPSAKRYATALWPHSAVLLHKGKIWRYYLMHAGEKRFEPIGTHAHEIGHVLGLPDEYGLGNRSGSGIYCLMAIGNGGGWDDQVAPTAPPVPPREAFRDFARDQLHELVDRLLGKRSSSSSELFCQQLGEDAGAPPITAARPLHLCAPCKAALGWVEPIGLARGQRIYLEPVEDHPGDVVALPLGRGRRLLLEYRGRRGFDAGMPRSGLLAWRTGDRLGASLRTLAAGANGELVPAHGVASVDAAHRDGVQWPWNGHATLELGDLAIAGIEEKDGRLYLEVR